MGEKSKEFLCFIVDVGPHMHSLLPWVEDYLVCSLEAKILNKPTHEVAVMLFGSTDTRNEPHEEMAAQGDEEQYLHISVQNNYQPPDVTTMEACRHLPRGAGYSDTLDALTVFVDMVVKANKERFLDNIPKRAVMISNFKGKGKGFDPDFKDHVVNSFRNAKVKFEVLHLDVPTPETQAPDNTTQDGTHTSAQSSTSQDEAAAMAENLDGITGILQELGGTDPKRIVSPADLAAAVKWAETAPTATYTGPLRIGKSTSIPVKMFKKSKKESLPSMKDYVPATAAAAASTATNQVIKSTEYRVEGDVNGEAVPDEQTTRAYRYGRECVPVDGSVETMMKFSVLDKGLWLWGFMPADQVTRFAFMSESLVVLPDKDAPGAASAISALVRAMELQNKVAVARYVYRANTAPKLLVLTPWLGTLRRPDCWIANQLPFEQDIKWVDFAALGRGVPLKPEQEAAADALVDEMQLTTHSGNRDILSPESTPNPVLRRFYTAVAAKALNEEGYQVPAASEDPVVIAVCNPRPEHAGSAMQRMSEVFPTTVIAKDAAAAAAAAAADGQQAGGEQGQQAVFGTPIEAPSQPQAMEAEQAGGPGVVGTATPEADFAALLQQPGKAKDAMSSMRYVILQLVDNSIGARNYDKAESCVKALRAAAVEHGLPRVFNEHLQGLVTRYKDHESHSGFLARLIDAGITLVSGEEVPEGTEGAASKEDADTFLARHSRPAADLQAGRQERMAAAAPVAAPPAPTQDFEDMD